VQGCARPARARTGEARGWRERGWELMRRGARACTTGRSGRGGGEEEMIGWLGHEGGAVGSVGPWQASPADRPTDLSDTLSLSIYIERS
jgi:hypothetical protein